MAEATNRHDIIGFGLSSQQRLLWALGDARGEFKTQCAIDLHGPLDTSVLKDALEDIVRRHESLRTVFPHVERAGRPLQVIDDMPIVGFEEIDLPGDTERQLTATCEEYYEKAFRREQHVEQAPLIWAWLLRASPHRSTLIVSVPSLCADRCTMHQLYEELGAAYAARQERISLPEAGTQYIDYSEWQSELLRAQDHSLVEDEHPSEFYDCLGLSVLEEQCPLAADVLPCEVPLTLGHLSQRVDTVARNLACAPEMLFRACYEIVLWLLNSRGSVVVGVMRDGRFDSALENAFGPFAYYVASHGYVDDSNSFADVVSRVCAAPSEVEPELRALHRRAASAIPGAGFYAYCFESVQWPVAHEAGAVRFSLRRVDAQIDRFKVKLLCHRLDGFSRLSLQYNPLHFAEPVVERLAQQISTVLGCVLQNPEVCVGELSLATDDGQAHLSIARAVAPVADAPTVVDLVEEQASRSPAATAVVYGDERLTYGALIARSNELAAHLVAHGIGQESLVAVCSDRTSEIAVACLGVLKAGAAFLPLDPSYPIERLRGMLADGRVEAVVVGQGELPELIADVPVVVELDQLGAAGKAAPPDVEIDSASLAYVVYTSGSSGRPKGVMVSHYNLGHYVCSLQRELGLKSKDHYLHHASISFSSAVRQLFLPLTVGATVVLTPADERADPLAVLRLIHRQKVTVVDVVPSFWRHCVYTLQHMAAVERARLLSGDLRLILCASEPLDADLVMAWRDELGHDARIINMYGLTETTGIVLVNHQTDGTSPSQVSLGRPIDHAQIYVMDRQQKLVPRGTPGELYVGGNGVSRGYRAQPAATARRYVPDPYSSTEGARLYRTGDLGVMRRDGSLVYLGRLDQQVKMRGFRIELGGVESLIRQYPGVRDVAVVVDQGPQDKHMVAYVQYGAELHKPSSFGINEFLAVKLPTYMLPAAYHFVDELPRTPTGKIDRRVLREAPEAVLERSAAYVAPREGIERALADLWENLLKVDRVGATDNFFELGGHSLLVAQVLARIRSDHGVELPFRRMFEAPTVAELAAQVEAATLAASRQQSDREEGAI